MDFLLICQILLGCNGVRRKASVSTSTYHSVTHSSLRDVSVASLEGWSSDWLALNVHGYREISYWKSHFELYIDVIKGNSQVIEVFQ